MKPWKAGRPIRLSFVVVAALTVSLWPRLGRAAESPASMWLWYRQPALQWLQAMPLGNGMIGAMVFGGIGEERTALNKSSSWLGSPHDYDDANAFQYFGQIRDLVFADKFQDAEKLANAHFWGVPKAQEAYQPIGDLLLSFTATNATNYRRELDMATGVATVTYEMDHVLARRKIDECHPSLTERGGHEVALWFVDAGGQTGQRGNLQTERPLNAP
jgi:hypothetical protein